MWHDCGHLQYLHRAWEVWTNCQLSRGPGVPYVIMLYLLVSSLIVVYVHSEGCFLPSFRVYCFKWFLCLRCFRAQWCWYAQCPQVCLRLWGALWRKHSWWMDGLLPGLSHGASQPWSQCWVNMTINTKKGENCLVLGEATLKSGHVIPSVCDKARKDGKLGKLVDLWDNAFKNHSRLHDCDSEAKEFYSYVTCGWRNTNPYWSGILL